MKKFSKVFLILLISFCLNNGVNAQILEQGKNYYIEKNTETNQETLFINGEKIQTAEKINVLNISDNSDEFYFDYIQKEYGEYVLRTVSNGKEINEGCYLAGKSFDSKVCLTYSDSSGLEYNNIEYNGKRIDVIGYGSRYYEPKPYIDDKGNLWYFAAEDFDNFVNEEGNISYYKEPTKVVIYKNEKPMYTISLGNKGYNVKDIQVFKNKTGYDFFYYQKTDNEYTFQPFINGVRLGEEYDNVAELFISHNDINKNFYKGYIKGEGYYLVINGERVSKAYSKIDYIIVNEDLTQYAFDGFDEFGNKETLSKRLEIDKYNLFDLEKIKYLSLNKNFLEPRSYYERFYKPNVIDITNIDTYGYIYDKRTYIKNGKSLFKSNKDMERFFPLELTNGKIIQVYTSTDETGYIGLYDTNNKLIGLLFEWHLYPKTSKVESLHGKKYYLYFKGQIYKVITPDLYYNHYLIDIEASDTEPAFKLQKFNNEDSKIHTKVYNKNTTKNKYLINYSTLFDKALPALNDTDFLKLAGNITQLNRKISKLLYQEEMRSSTIKDLHPKNKSLSELREFLKVLIFKMISELDNRNLDL